MSRWFPIGLMKKELIFSLNGIRTLITESGLWEKVGLSYTAVFCFLSFWWFYVTWHCLVYCQMLCYCGVASKCFSLYWINCGFKHMQLKDSRTSLYLTRSMAYTNDPLQNIALQPGSCASLCCWHEAHAEHCHWYYMKNLGWYILWHPYNKCILQGGMDLYLTKWFSCLIWCSPHP